MTLVVVTGTDEEQPFETNANLTALWTHRPDTQSAEHDRILKAVSEVKLPLGPGFVWIAAEATVSRALRTYFIDTLRHPSE